MSKFTYIVDTLANFVAGAGLAILTVIKALEGDPVSAFHYFLAFVFLTTLLEIKSDLVNSK